MRSDGRGGAALLVPGTGWAFLGVLAFSFTLPMNRLAIQGFDAAVVGSGRTVLAAMVAGAVLAIRRVPFPPRETWGSFVAVALGVGIGFGFLSSLALRTETAAHGAVVIALLPVATALVATIRGGERPGRTFWAASIAGTAIVVAYVLARSGGSPSGADGLFAVATVLAAVGYAEGGRVARTMPGWQVIAWGLVLATPVALPLVVVSALTSSAPVADPGPAAVVGFLYLALVSMLLGFVAWYRGLAEAGVARASQVQLLQPLLTVLWAGLLLGERIEGATVVAAVGVVVCIAATQRARIAGDVPSAA